MTLQDAKDIGKAIIIEAVAIMMGIIIGGLVLQQAAPVKVPPAEVTVVVVPDTLVSSSIDALRLAVEESGGVLDAIHRQQVKSGLERLKMDELRFNNYVNH